MNIKSSVIDLSLIMNHSKDEIITYILILRYYYNIYDSLNYTISSKEGKKNYSVEIKEGTTVGGLKSQLYSMPSENNNASGVIFWINDNFDEECLQDNDSLNIIINSNSKCLSVSFIAGNCWIENYTLCNFTEKFKLLLGMELSSNIIIDQINLITEQELYLIKSFEKSKDTVKEQNTLLDMFNSMINSSPAEIALIEGDFVLSRIEYDWITNFYARIILNIETDKLNIGIYCKSELNANIAIFSIIKTGKCFVPLSVQNPIKRSNYIIEDACIDVILSDQPLIADLNVKHIIHLSPKELNLGEGTESVEPEKNYADPEKPAYIIYTSGTTGSPKGVIISQKSIVTILIWFIKYFPLNYKTRTLHILSYTFDFGLYDLLSGSLCGGILYFIDKKGIRGYKDYCSIINDSEINNICITPSLCNILVSCNIVMSTIKYLHLGGENLTYQMVDSYKKIFNNTCKYYNGYGPSECTIGNTIYMLNDTSENTGSVPIGYPNGNSSIYLLNKGNERVPLGGIGEICISGDGLAKGYVGTDAPLAKTCPLCGEEKMYRSGDLGYWNSKGALVFVRRIVDDIKINGYRIDILEIEKSIKKISAITECSVVVESGYSLQSLNAYYCTNSPISKKEIRQILKQYLPEYMLPTKYIELLQLPLNKNGKIDKNKLLTLV